MPALQALDHFIVMALMDKLREKGYLNTGDMVEIMDKASQNFDEHKMEVARSE